MIREYKNKNIYRLLNICQTTSAVSTALLLALIFAFAMCSIYGEYYDESLFAILAGVFSPSALAAIATLCLTCYLKNAKPYEEPESRWHNDATTVTELVTFAAISSFLSFLPSNFCTYAYAIRLRRMIYREYKENPPAHIVRAQKERQLLNEADGKSSNNSSSNETSYIELLSICGMRFFVQYYIQLANLPVRDIVIDEDYSIEERNERIFAAKKIIANKEEQKALDHIITNYGHILDTKTIDHARKLLEYLQDNRIS